MQKIKKEKFKNVKKKSTKYNSKTKKLDEQNLGFIALIHKKGNYVGIFKYSYICTR